MSLFACLKILNFLTLSNAPVKKYLKVRAAKAAYGALRSPNKDKKLFMFILFQAQYALFRIY